MNWTCRFCNKRTSHPAPWKGCPNLITLFAFRFSLFGKVDAGIPSQKGKSDKIKRTCRLYEVTQAVVPNLDWGQEILHRIHRNSGNARTNLANPADLQDSRFAHSRLQCAHLNLALTKKLMYAIWVKLRRLHVTKTQISATYNLDCYNLLYAFGIQTCTLLAKKWVRRLRRRQR